MQSVRDWYIPRPKRYVGCFLSRMLNWMSTCYNELRSVLMIGEIERVRWEATNGKELQITNQVESFDYFLNEGEKYLVMAQDLHEFNEESSKLLPRVVKALDTYTRLNAFCKSTNLWDSVSLYQYEHFFEKSAKDKHVYDEEIAKDEHNEENINNENKRNEEIIKNKKKRDKKIEQDEGKRNERIAKDENEEIVVEKKKYNIMTEDVLFLFRETEEKDSDSYSGSDDCYADNLLAKDYRVVIFLRQLMSIKSLVAELQDLYAAFNKRRLSLYMLLEDYCLKAGSFLRGNEQFRSSKKFRRGKERSMRRKYRHLEQLIARIIQEREYMAKYIETADDHRSEANAK